MNNSQWEDHARERIAARRRKIGELLADEQDFPKQECLQDQLQHLSFVETFAAACTRVAAGDLTPEELAQVERARPLFRAALEGKTLDELQAMKARLEAQSQPEPEASYVAVDSDIPF